MYIYTHKRYNCLYIEYLSHYINPTSIYEYTYIMSIYIYICIYVNVYTRITLGLTLCGFSTDISIGISMGRGTNIKSSSIYSSGVNVCIIISFSIGTW